MPLTFEEVTRVNLARCDRWHAGGIADWTIADWAVAMAGEAGEVCNAVKKLRRIEDGMANVSDADRQLSTRQQAIEKIGEELADTFLYLNLLACRIGVDLPTAIVAKFNATSERYGFPERLLPLVPEVEAEPMLAWRAPQFGADVELVDPSGVVVAKVYRQSEFGGGAVFYTASLRSGADMGVLTGFWPDRDAACQAVEEAVGQAAKRVPGGVS